MAASSEREALARERAALAAERAALDHERSRVQQVRPGGGSGRGARPTQGAPPHGAAGGRSARDASAGRRRMRS